MLICISCRFVYSHQSFSSLTLLQLAKNTLSLFFRSIEALKAQKQYWETYQCQRDFTAEISHRHFGFVHCIIAPPPPPLFFSPFFLFPPPPPLFKRSGWLLSKSRRKNQEICWIYREYKWKWLKNSFNQIPLVSKITAPWKPRKIHEYIKQKNGLARKLHFEIILYKTYAIFGMIKYFWLHFITIVQTV